MQSPPNELTPRQSRRGIAARYANYSFKIALAGHDKFVYIFSLGFEHIFELLQNLHADQLY